MAKWSEKEAAILSLESGGFVDPSDLVEAARDPRHPCHGDFTWDVPTAARERWHQQACALIRKVSFEVTEEEIGTRCVSFVPSPQYSQLYESLPNIRSVSKVSAVLKFEVDMLHGSASRVYGIALAKVDIVGDDAVVKLQVIRDTLAVLKQELTK